MNLNQAALKLLTQNLALKKGEKVIVVSDRKHCRVFDAVCKATISMGGELTKIHITNKRMPSEPLPKLKNVFARSDVIIGIVDKSITHCPEVRIARKRHGARAVTFVGVDEKLFLKAMKADQKQIKKINNKLVKKLKRCKIVKIVTPAGTDVVFRMIKSSIGPDDGDSTKRGKLNNIPFGEVAVAPINIANGTVAIDFSRINVKQKDRVKVMIKNGKIIGWNNNIAKKFVDYLRKVDGERALHVVELGFGTNPLHKKLIGKIIHDEKIWGSIHVAFGGFGNARKCKIHEDVILLRPTVYFDGKMVIRNGKIL
ncbi:MAG: aminopeptidase [Candidatus Aenigmatarchaeota archaeon]